MARPLRPSPTAEPYYGEVAPGEHSVVQETVTEVTDGPGDLWPWLAGLGLAVLLVVGYFALHDSSSDEVVPQNSPTPVATVIVNQPAPVAPPVIVPPPQQAPPQNTTVIVQQPPQQSPAESQPAPSAS
jgi:hypothetical protein